MSIPSQQLSFLPLAPRSTGPLVLTCEHASGRLPFRAGIDARQKAILASHWGWDIGAWELTRDLARRLRASAVGGRWSRLVVDLNRKADDPTLIRERVEGVALSWNSELPVEEIERRILEYHVPYHIEVDRLIVRRLVRGIRPLVFSVHSFTPEFRGRERKFEIGVLYEHHPDLAHTLVRSLRRTGLTVRYNQPYSGMAGLMYSADRHGRHHGLPCLELEVNQGLFERPGAATRLGSVVAQALRELELPDA